MIRVNIDIKQLEDLMNFDKGIKKIKDEAAQDLMGMVQAKATEIAGQKLRTRRDMFIQGIKPPTKVDEDTWMIALDGKVVWIDDGQPQYDMLKHLLNSPKVKRDKDGNRYIVVPFNHSPGLGKTGATKANQDLIATVKSEMKKRGIPFGGIEKNPNGAPKLGKLHSFSIMNSPVKKANAPGLGNAGMGHGPVGEVRQGNTGIPFLQGVQVYQSIGKTGKAKRSILTFRIASEKHRSQGKWQHPGNAPVNIMEEATEWALTTWEKEIAPAIIDKVVSDL